MKGLKKWTFRILKVVGIIVLLYFVVALFAPSSYKVERTQEFSVTPEAVYQQIYDFENWEAWSPWLAKDPSCKYTYTGEAGTVGSQVDWDGDPDLSGKGSMKLIELVENEKIRYELSFEGMGPPSTGGFDLEEIEDGVKLTWFDGGDIPFMFRPMMLMMDLEEMIGKDFEAGLKNMVPIAEAYQEELKTKYVINEIDFPGASYYGIKSKVNMEDIDSTLFGSVYGQLGMFCGTNAIEMTGMPVSLCFEWNLEEQSGVLMPAFPVGDNSMEATEGITAFTQDACKALVVDYYGPYEETGVAHEQIEAYVQENGLKYSVVMEEFVTDPGTVEGMDQVLTKIYYFLD